MNTVLHYKEKTKRKANKLKNISNASKNLKSNSNFNAHSDKKKVHSQTAILTIGSVYSCYGAHYIYIQTSEIKHGK